MSPHHILKKFRDKRQKHRSSWKWNIGRGFTDQGTFQWIDTSIYSRSETFLNYFLKKSNATRRAEKLFALGSSSVNDERIRSTCARFAGWGTETSGRLLGTSSPDLMIRQTNPIRPPQQHGRCFSSFFSNKNLMTFQLWTENVTSLNAEKGPLLICKFKVILYHSVALFMVYKPSFGIKFVG